MLETIISIGSLATGINSTISGVRHGRKLDTVLGDLRSLNYRIEQLETGLSYVPELSEVTYSGSQSNILTNPDHVAQSLRSFRNTLGGHMLSTQMISAPTRFDSLLQDPSEIFIDMRPLANFYEHQSIGLTPVLFNLKGIPYVGWQKKKILSHILGIDFSPVELPFGNEQSIPNIPIDAGNLSRSSNNIAQKNNAKLDRNLPFFKMLGFSYGDSLYNVTGKLGSPEADYLPDEIMYFPDNNGLYGLGFSFDPNTSLIHGIHLGSNDVFGRIPYLTSMPGIHGLYGQTRENIISILGNPDYEWEDGVLDFYNSEYDPILGRQARRYEVKFRVDGIYRVVSEIEVYWFYQGGYYFR